MSGQDKSYIRKVILYAYENNAFKENKVFKLISLDMEAEEASVEQKTKMKRKGGMYFVRFEIKGYNIENNTGHRYNVTGRYFILFTHQYEVLLLDSY